jgi:tetratricopeptide (TPR) repeat protein
MRFVFVLALVTSIADAQSGPSCHKGHARDYKMSEVPPPHKIEGIGNSHLTITAKSPEAQAWFDQGFNLLHCFWDFEAHRAFKEAARLDPDAAMAWWGIAQSLDGYKAMEDERNAALEKAQALLPKISDHEQFYIRAQQKKEDEDTGKEDFLREMENLIDKYPDDIDAKLFLAIGSTFGYDHDGKPEKYALYPQMLLRDVVRAHPDSAAAHHYLIHALESSFHAQDALGDADSLSKLAPGSGHMVHMPGHIYYRLGLYDRARQSFMASKKVDEDYMKRENISTLDNWNYAHNLSYLIASDAEAGRYHEALELANLLEKLPAQPFLAKGTPLHVLTVGGTSVRLKIRFGNYQDAIDHPIPLGLDESDAGASAKAYRDGILAYAKGMQALLKKDHDAAQRYSDALDAISWRLHAEKPEDAEEDHPDQVLRILETSSLDLRGQLRAAQGNFDEGIELLKKAVDKEKAVGYNEPPQYGRPELEALGYSYIHAHKYEEARDAFRRELKIRPNSGHDLYGIAQSYEAAGQREEAARAYREFLEAWRDADPELPMVKHARTATR